MTTQAFILELLKYIIPALTLVLTYAWHSVNHLVPQAQRDLLKLIAGPIVDAIKAQFGSLTPDEQKAKVLAIIAGIFQVAGVKLPDQAILDEILDVLLGIDPAPQIRRKSR